MYVGNSMEIPVENGALRALRSAGTYPWHEAGEDYHRLSVQPVRHTLALRLPDWCPCGKVLTLNGLEVEQDIRKGYLHLSVGARREGDTITLTLPCRFCAACMAIALARHVAGQVAIRRGPAVYCLEQADNGEELCIICGYRRVSSGSLRAKGLLRIKMLIQAEGENKSAPRCTRHERYCGTDNAPSSRQPRTLTFIPWF